MPTSTDSSRSPPITLTSSAACHAGKRDAEKLESLQQNIDLRKQKGFAAAQQQVTTGIGSAEWTRSEPLFPR